MAADMAGVTSNVTSTVTSIVTPMFIIWVAYSLYRGYRRGLWRGLFTLAALVVAYVGCYLWAPTISNLLLERGWSLFASYSTAFFSLYALLYLTVAELPNWVLRKWLSSVAPQHWWGAGLGGCAGIVSGLVFIWTFSLLQAAVSLQAEPVGASNQSMEIKKPAVVSVANALMAEVTRAGAGIAGVDPLQTEVMVTFSREPQKALQDLHSLGQSKQLQAFLSDSDIQHYMATENLDGLIESAAFQNVITLPALEGVRQMARVEASSGGREAGVREGDLYLAARYTEARNRLDLMRDDPRLQAIVADPEVKAMIEKRDIPGLLTNSKVQNLMALVMSGEVMSGEIPQSREPQTEVGVGAGLESPPRAPVNIPVAPVKMYKWRDQSGQIRYSDSPPENDNVEIIIH
ncbi:CvpA family protein [Teredinibacter franksiae]|uniref:CvpA family protein n=1 Tax=Teredinibacter franksiae TaxID=2761453 RepID=UPI001623762E|nr:CvpA family protein [Teredinibacter franksiae]